MKKTFLNYDRPLLTAMVQGKTPDRIKYLIDRCREQGADAVGVQFEQLSPEFKTDEVIRDLRIRGDFFCILPIEGLEQILRGATLDGLETTLSDQRIDGYVCGMTAEELIALLRA